MILNESNNVVKDIEGFCDKLIKDKQFKLKKSPKRIKTFKYDANLYVVEYDCGKISDYGTVSEKSVVSSIFTGKGYRSYPVEHGTQTIEKHYEPSNVISPKNKLDIIDVIVTVNDRTGDVRVIFVVDVPNFIKFSS